MKKSAFTKDLFMDIKKSKGRFFSILAIIALGVAFFSGIKSAPIAMKETADKYYDDYNFMDFTLYSTLGFNDEDIKEISNLNGVLEVYPTYSLDALIKVNSSEIVLKVMEMPINNDDFINEYRLIEGRFPSNEKECVIEAGKLNDLNISIGDTINLASGTNEGLEESLNNITYTVVGKVQTPNYLSYEKGTSEIGNGKVSSFIVIPEGNFKLEAYTEVYLTVFDSKELNTYSNKYEDLINTIKPNIEELGNKRSNIRFNEIIDKAKEEIEENRVKLEKEKQKGLLELKDANEKLANAENIIQNSEVELLNQENIFKETILQAENELSLNEEKIASGRIELHKAKKEFEDKKTLAYEKINKAKLAKDTLEDKVKEIDKDIISIEAILKDPNLETNEQETLNNQLNNLKSSKDDINLNIDNIRAEIISGENQIKDGQEILNSKEIFFNNSEDLINEKKKELILSKESAIKEFEDNKKKLENSKIELTKNREEYNNSKEKFNKEILDAENKITKAEEDLKNLPEGKWYVLDRDSHYSFVDYENNAESIDKLAKVFPIFFFLVAALVCLTTMTRMVDEQRINIGTLKALGYSKYKIISKYIIYAFLASFIGSIVGLAIGFTLFPIIIFNAYGIMYSLPKIELGFNLQIALIIIIIAVLVTTIASFSACYKELMETPSVLMRPRAPKIGKRILLERFTRFWNNLSFTGKVTTRNIFRYKKRFLMTVFGIAGCTALILTGFGVKDSIKTIVDRQFGYILKYNLSINLDKEISNIEKENTISDINNINEIKNTLMVLSNNIKIYTDKGEKDGYIIVPENTSNFDDFINLENRKSKEKISLTDEGIIISEKVAKQSNIDIGDFVNIGLDNSTYYLKVIGIAENYTFNYIYMNNEYYKKIFNKEPVYNTILANTEKIQNDKDFSKGLMEHESIKGVSFNTSIKENFDNTIKSLNSVVLIMIISAGALAFIVLYNLTNVNISERIREIATIKVLGFYDKEVSAYIYRENIILTILGIFFGGFIGAFLHRFIMITVEIDNMMFGRNIDYKSFIYSALLTIIFSVMVNIAMYYKLKKVQMVESLKSVD